MKNITNSDITRSINGGGVTITSVMTAMGLIYGTVEACKWAWNTGSKWGNALGKKIFKK